MILEGCCHAVKQEEGKPDEIVKVFKSGDYFGDRDILKDVPLGINIRAHTYVYVVSLDKQHFDRMLSEIQGKLIRDASEYHAEVPCL
jgi:CRP-like cAMP-binding protein